MVIGVSATCPTCGGSFRTCTPGIECYNCEQTSKKQTHDEGKCQPFCLYCYLDKDAQSHRERR